MSDLTSNQALIKSLACTALSPGLRSILVFDAPYSGLQHLAAMLEQLLGVTAGLPVQPYQLGPFETDDAVWGSVALPGKAPLLRLFSQERNAREFQLITIPDLAILSQAAARTCTMLVGAEVVHLERHEQHQIWKPRQCWLAGCTRADVGKISPHLLDRFALRMHWHDIDPTEQFSHQKRVANLLAHVPHDSLATDKLLSPTMLRQIEVASHQRVEMPPAILARVMDYLPHGQSYPRREIALARFALALAQFAGSPDLHEEHVEEAARLLGMTAQADAEQEDASEEEEEPFKRETQEEPPEQLSAQPESARPQTLDTSQTQQVNMPETISSPDIETGTLCSENPYPEDTAFVEREAASLQLSITPYSYSRSTHGPIIGIEESETLSDLAIVSTVMSALKFQKIRCSTQQGKERKIAFEPTDLRRHRRGSALEHVLMILLDYTSVRDNVNWQDALLPYLSQAYADRAEIVLIKVGAEDAVHELQAEIVNARNIIVPSIGEALELGSGKASPLAHGFNLARARLRHLFQHGRTLARAATFLVISDGRGNVPREASLKNSIQKNIIGQEGVEDALAEAVRVSIFQRVETIVLNPQPLDYPELPEILAQALGAKIQIIPHADGHEKAGAAM